MQTERALTDVWRARDNGNAERLAARSAFTGAVKDVAKKTTNLPQLLSLRLVGLYDDLIDYGAHPNPGSVYGAVTLEDHCDGHHKRVSFTGIDGLDSNAVRNALLACMETGIVLFTLAGIGVQFNTCEAEATNRDAFALHERYANFQKERKQAT
jgi:hypothetical protein